MVTATDDGDPAESVTDTFVWMVTSVNAVPLCVDAEPSRGLLWPPNRRFHAVTTLGVTDPDDDPFTIVIDAITQDEPVDVPSRRFAPDAFGVGTDSAQLRAERIGARRRGGGNGRVYQVAFTATDTGGLACSGLVSVAVPRHPRRPRDRRRSAGLRLDRGVDAAPPPPPHDDDDDDGGIGNDDDDDDDGDKQRDRNRRGRDRKRDKRDDDD